MAGHAPNRGIFWPLQGTGPRCQQKRLTSCVASSKFGWKITLLHEHPHILDENPAWLDSNRLSNLSRLPQVCGLSFGLPQLQCLKAWCLKHAATCLRVVGTYFSNVCSSGWLQKMCCKDLQGMPKAPRRTPVVSVSWRSKISIICAPKGLLCSLFAWLTRGRESCRLPGHFVVNGMMQPSIHLYLYAWCEIL